MKIKSRKSRTRHSDVCFGSQAEILYTVHHDGQPPATLKSPEFSRKPKERRSLGGRVEKAFSSTSKRLTFSRKVNEISVLMDTDNIKPPDPPPPSAAKTKPSKPPNRRRSLRKNLSSMLGTWILGRTFSPKERPGDESYNDSTISADRYSHESHSSMLSHAADTTVTSVTSNMSNISIHNQSHTDKVKAQDGAEFSPTPVALKTRSRTALQAHNKQATIPENGENDGGSEENSFRLAMNASNTRMNLQRTTNFALKGLRLFSTAENSKSSQSAVGGMVTRRASQKHKTTEQDKENCLPPGSDSTLKSGSCLGGRKVSLAANGTPILTSRGNTPASGTRGASVVNRVHAGHTPCPTRRRTRRSYNERLI